jgi:hypothetical protein
VASPSWFGLRHPVTGVALFAANGAWLFCAVMAFNLTRAPGALPSAFHARVIDNVDAA